MSSLSAQRVRRDHEDFVDALIVTMSGFARDGRGDSSQRAIFKSCSAGQVVLQSFVRAPHQNELLSAAAGLVRRVAVLCAVRQYSLSRVEMRRLIECAVWYVYFIDHAVEWAEFRKNPMRANDERSRDPIVSAASALTSVFFAYAKERFSPTACDIGRDAVDRLKSYYGRLSGEVHAGMGAVHQSGSLALASDRHEPALVNQLAKDVKQIVKQVVLTLVCANPLLLPPSGGAEEPWLSYLLGQASIRVRAATFGIMR